MDCIRPTENNYANPTPTPTDVMHYQQVWVQSEVLEVLDKVVGADGVFTDHLVPAVKVAKKN